MKRSNKKNYSTHHAKRKKNGPEEDSVSDPLNIYIPQTLFHNKLFRKHFLTNSYLYNIDALITSQVYHCP